MACQWNANTYPTNQRNGMQNGGTMQPVMMQPGVTQPGVMQPGVMQQGTMPLQMQIPTCAQMNNIRTRTPQQTMAAGTVGMPMPAAGMPLPPPAATETPSTVQSPYYTAGFLRNFIGCNMRVEFLIGTSGALVDRIGVLMEVGASYIVLQPFQTDDLLMCDLYSIKFVTIYG